MMQMQPHLQHHSQPPMHPGQAQPQPPPHHMQMNPMAAAAQQQQQMMVQQQQQQMGMSPQQQQQQQMQQKPPYQCNMNGMMNMGMTPPQSHYMNQQYSSHLTDVTQSATRTTAPSASWSSDAAAAATGWSHEPPPGCPSSVRQPSAAERHSPAMYPATDCQNPAIVNSDWEDEYCSNECVITHCRDVFGNWVQTNNSQQQTYSAVK
nr:TOX high mobility group box family member 4-A-like isoform X2 [Aedes albopictus]